MPILRRPRPVTLSVADGTRRDGTYNAARHIQQRQGRRLPLPPPLHRLQLVIVPNHLLVYLEGASCSSDRGSLQSSHRKRLAIHLRRRTVEARLQHNPLDCDVRPFVVVYKCNKAIVNLLCWANQKFVCRCDRSARALHHLHEPCRPIRRPQSQTRLIDPVDGPLFSGCPLPLHGPFSTALWVLSRPRSLPNRLK